MKFFTKIHTIKFTLLLLVLANISYAKQTITIGVETTDYYPHYDFLSAKPGFTSEVLKLFEKKSNYAISLKALPVKRLYKSLLSGSIDCKYPDNPLWQPQLRKKAKFYYSQPVSTILGGAVVRIENKNMTPNLVRRLGVILGFSTPHWSDSITKHNINVLENPTTQGLLKQLIAKRVEAVDMDVSISLYQLQLMKKSNEVTFAKNLPTISTKLMLSSIKRPDIIDHFNKFLEENSHQIQQLKKQFNIIEAIENLPSNIR